jgi:hypothetical protein
VQQRWQRQAHASGNWGWGAGKRLDGEKQAEVEGGCWW